MEARQITKWNKRRLSKLVRRRRDLPSGKGGYKKTGFDGRRHTMA